MSSAARQPLQYLPLQGGEPAPDMIRGRLPATWSGGAGWGSTRGRDDHPKRAPRATPPPDSICFEPKQMLSTSPLQGEVWSLRPPTGAYAATGGSTSLSAGDRYWQSH